MRELSPAEMREVERRGDDVLDEIVAVMLQQGMTEGDIEALDPRAQENLVRLSRLMAHLRIEAEGRGKPATPDGRKDAKDC